MQTIAGFVSKHELAKRENVTVRSVERWIERGLPFSNFYGKKLFMEEESAEWIRAYRAKWGPRGTEAQQKQ